MITQINIKNYLTGVAFFAGKPVDFLSKLKWYLKICSSVAIWIRGESAPKN